MSEGDKPLVYLETSFVSHVAARESSDPLRAARQQSSRRWWSQYRYQFALVVSATVYEECREGDLAMAEQRLAIIGEASLLEPQEAILELARLYIEPIGPLPVKAGADALHIASAIVYKCEFLLTWNFKHIANAMMRHRIERITRNYGYEPTTICTPDELMGGLA